MAHYERFINLRSAGYQRVMDGSAEFVDWFNRDGDPSAYVSTDFAHHVETEAPEDEPTCLMDYLFVWLVEGEATLYCPTYESWLLTIISIADQLRRGRFGSRWTRPNADGVMPQWPDPEDRDLSELRVGEDGRSIDMPLLSGEVNLSHPALDRVLFERAKTRREWSDRVLG